MQAKGTFDIGLGLSTAWQNVIQNLGPVLGAVSS